MTSWARSKTIYLDDETGQPEWALVYAGLFSTKAAFVPLAGAEATGDAIECPTRRHRSATPRAWRPAVSCPRTRRPSSAALRLDHGEHRSDSGLPAGERDRDGDGVCDDAPDSAVGRDTRADHR